MNCPSAHSCLAKNLAHLDDPEVDANRAGRSGASKAEAALQFATKVVRARGHAAAADVELVKAAGYDDGQIVEILAHVALNTLTNYVNTSLGTAVDFPAITPRAEYGDLCAVAVSMGERVASDATSRTVHGGRTFRFSSPEAKAMFDAAPATYITKADANWPRLR